MTEQDELNAKFLQHISCLRARIYGLANIMVHNKLTDPEEIEDFFKQADEMGMKMLASSIEDNSHENR